MEIFRKFALSVVILIAASQAQAILYERDFINIGRDYLRSLGHLGTDNTDRMPLAQRDKCLSKYRRIMNNGVLDMRIIIGYFDWTTGSIVNKDGTNYGYSPSIDPGAYRALRNILTRRCPGGAEFCGFDEETAYRFTKRVKIQGRNVQAKVQIYYASVSEYFSANTGQYSFAQQTRSAASQAQFRDALQNADVVFYFGHSRNGGGPDFNPPIFINGTNKVNYGGYYKPNRPGLKKMLSALQGGSRQPWILGLMSCDSRDHFLSSIRSVAPRTGLISSLNVLQVDGVYTAMIGAADAVLRGQCQSGFMESIRRTDFNARNITMDGVFQ
jgi:hypothetical protein